MAEIVPVHEICHINMVAALARRIWRQHFIPLVGEEQVTYMLEQFQSASAIKAQIEAEGYDYYLVKEDGEWAGYFAIVPQSGQCAAQLSKIYVDAGKRRKGLGREILDYVEKRCGEYGISKLWLTVNRYNVSAISFYRKMGFGVEEHLVQDIGQGFVMDDYKMAKRLE